MNPVAQVSVVGAPLSTFNFVKLHIISCVIHATMPPSPPPPQVAMFPHIIICDHFRKIML